MRGNINMSREISLNIGQNNRDEYCRIIGCKRDFWDLRFCDGQNAVLARDYLIELREKGENFGTLAKKIGVSSATISRVAGGNAGLIPIEKYNGRSTTEYVVDSLGEMVKSR